MSGEFFGGLYEQEIRTVQINECAVSVTDRGRATPDCQYGKCFCVAYDTLEDLNWAGFYLMENGILVLGPFQGKTACIEIRVGKGVCGTAVERDEIMLVEDVHQFPGHIACDSASNSEIVLPIHANGEIIGVLDIDSPSLARFDEEDRTGLAEFVRIFEENW